VAGFELSKDSKPEDISEWKNVLDATLCRLRQVLLRHRRGFGPALAEHAFSRAVRQSVDPLARLRETVRLGESVFGAVAPPPKTSPPNVSADRAIARTGRLK
jgi:hypothetical protein